MKILVLNCGSSSLKYQLFNMQDKAVMAKGLVEKIGLAGANLEHRPQGMDKIRIDAEILDHTEAIRLVIDALTHAETGVIKNMNEIKAVGHRVVHGGSAFADATLITDEVMQVIHQLVELAPLHNPPSILGIEACLSIMPQTPMVAVFDTAFHQTMPPANYIYGLPYEYYEKYGIRRYGFHGTSHRFVSERTAHLMGRDIKDLKLITCHLGNGSSITAIKDGVSLNTSMGFTPLEGLMMGTRCGDIDPAIVPFIMEKENLSTTEISTIMNKKSGFIGVSGVSSDMRDVEKAAGEGNKRAGLALEIFFNDLIHYIGAYTAQMNGVDAIVFTAGIGENGPETRELICQRLSFLGIEVDKVVNDCKGKEVKITTPNSKVQVWVVPTNEELTIALDTMAVISGS